MSHQDRRFLLDDQAVACCVLWASGLFSTYAIATLLSVPEDAVVRTLHFARDEAQAKYVSDGCDR